jgi:hypothetical protein
MKPDDVFKPSRRQVAAGVMVTAAAAIAAPAAAQENSQVVLPNPLNQYPKPPFPRQQQEPPGLSLKMHPQPDYGEKPIAAPASWPGARR